jgi:hypothetical protein
MSDQPPVPAADSTFEGIKRVSPEGNEFWSARDLAHVLEYSVFRNFQPVIEKAKEACIKSGHSVADHFAEMRNMVGIGSGAQRELEDLANPIHHQVGRKVRQTIRELGGTMPENLPVAESIKNVESREKNRLNAGQTKALPNVEGE